MNLMPLLRRLARGLRALLASLAFIGAVYYANFLWNGPELKPWHRADLVTEFKARDYENGKVTTIAQYRQLEERLFGELQRKVYDETAAADRLRFNRYFRGSASDPGRWRTNWNRTFIMPPAGRPVGGVLLLHGLTDSPYSLRSVGVALVEQGYYVVGLRLPGHGTAPSALTTVDLEDLTAATRLAMHDLHARVGAQAPLYIIGYSNGAALAVNYCLDARADRAQPMPAGLVLISPAIGVSRLAAIGRIRTGLSGLRGLGRAAWQLIEMEVDPFKYQSFAFNAAGVTQRLTSSLTRRIARLSSDGPVTGLPPMLTFLSTVDSTVQARAVVDSLLGRLASQGHELVLFDVNRLSVVQPLLVADPAPLTRAILAQPQRPFALTLVTNASPETLRVLERRTPAGSGTSSDRDLALEWPRNVFSLSHVALPFPPDDPLYGYEGSFDTSHVQLGRLEVRGERGVLNIPGWMLTRQRSNPFHAYMLDRIVRFVASPNPAVAPGS